MRYRLVLAGNVTAIAITIGGFLQLYSWPVAGLLTLVSLVTPIMLSHHRLTGQVDLAPTRVSEEPAKQFVARGQDLKPTVQQRAKTKHEEPGPSPRKPVQPKTAPTIRPGEAPTIIKPDDFLTFDLDLESGNRVEGKISASGLVNAYILTEDNLTNLDLGQEFWYETGSEGVEEATLQFVAPEDGEWVLVVENVDSREISVTVKIRVTQESPARKPIHGSLAEPLSGLTPADGKLESL